MQIVNRTAYTHDCLTEFNRQHQRTQKRILNILFAVAGGLALLTLILSGILALLDGEDAPDVSTSTVIYLLAALLLLAFWVFIVPVLTKRSIRKQAAQNTVVDYRFTEEMFEENTVSATVKEQSQIQYAIITKITESEHYIYLYVNSIAAHIVDKRGFTEGTLDDLKTLLRMKVDGKKIHIK